jgi:glycine cleavage system H lipoate-binding protein
VWLKLIADKTKCIVGLCKWYTDLKGEFSDVECLSTKGTYLLAGCCLFRMDAAAGVFAAYTPVACTIKDADGDVVRHPKVVGQKPEDAGYGVWWFFESPLTSRGLPSLRYAEDGLGGWELV